jgi:nuclease-like protein
MSTDPNEQWARVELGETLVGRRAGGSAAAKARELRSAQPIRTLLARALRVHTDDRAWRRGASGERITGSWLGRLPDGWFVFHDIPVGRRGANIDHLVIGPGGVFTINTKNLSGSIVVNPRTLTHNGYRTNFLPKASEEARRAATLLSAAIGTQVEVRGLLAILADEWTVKKQPTDVFVGGPRGAKHWMLRQPAVLRSQDVIALVAAASKPITWRLRSDQAPPS